MELENQLNEFLNIVPPRASKKRRTSQAAGLFTVNEQQTKQACNFCPKSYTGGHNTKNTGTKSIIKHLKSAHSDIPQAAAVPVIAPPHPAVQHLDEFLASPRVPNLNVDVLRWWKGRPEYSLLFPLVRKFLAKPITSAESERTFSATGRIYTPIRTLLGAAVANMLVVSYMLMKVFSYKFEYPEEIA